MIQLRGALNIFLVKVGTFGLILQFFPLASEFVQIII